MYYEIGESYSARGPEPFGFRRRFVKGVTDQFSDGFHAIQGGADSDGTNPHLNVFARETSEYLEVGEQPKGFEKFQQIALGPLSDGGRQPGSSVATVSLRTAEQSSQKLYGFGVLRLGFPRGGIRTTDTRPPEPFATRKGRIRIHSDR
jgi:hypothetical protein